MKNMVSVKRALIVALLVLMLGVAVGAFAQEGEATPAPEGAATTETTAEAASTEGEAVAAEGEAAPSTNPLVPLGINTGFLIAQIFNFLVLFGLLTFFLWRPLMNMLDSRAAKIQKGLEDAAQAAAARKSAEADAEKVLAEARVQSGKLVEEARTRGDEVAKQIQAEARTEADKIRAEGSARVEQERDSILADVRGQIPAIATAISERLIGETLDEKRQQALVKDFFAKVPAEAKSLSGSVEVVSAMPLSDDEKNKIKAETGATDVTFRVDPAILGGLVIRSSDRVIDGSVRSGLNDLSSRLR